MITANTKLNAVIGSPLAHSLSPALHSYVYKLLGIDAVLLAFDSLDLPALLTAIKTLPINLCTVTMPHKENIMQYLDTIDDEARVVDAVNTVLNKNGILKGHNTDIIGVRESFAHIPLKGKRVLVVGSGGAAHAVAYVLSKSGGLLHIYSRNAQQARLLAEKYDAKPVTLKDALSDNFDIIANATPVGMYPNTKGTPLDGYCFRPGQVAFDCIYNPPETRFLREARIKGAQTISGLDMFLYQALAQIELWTKTAIPEPIRQQAKSFLATQLSR
ncbi:shikimate dehydrogenase [Candidatus Uhrbacteria bacterium]|nr:shikimate dehydrogenase [Candidatus Uhrbacteria bacterium]